MRKAQRLVLIAATLCCAQAPSAQDVVVDEAAVAAARVAFIERMVAKHGFDPDAIAATLTDVAIDVKVLEAISRPAERVSPWYEYRNIFLNPERISAGVAFWRANEAAIEATTHRYPVQPELLLAIVGVESLFGQRMGRYRVLDALGTLAFAYPPRSAFFASELEAFLLLSRDDPDMLGALGSYAGAMGAGQFIPSSYRAYAVDADGDGRRDVWADWEDILASVANYLEAHGWRAGEPVAAEAVKGPTWSGPEPGERLGLNATVGALSEAGYLFSTDLPVASEAMVFSLEHDPTSSEYWVGFHNFDVITRYNRSVKYALAAHQLSLAIRAAYEQEHASLAQ
ncbi:MAG TPA: lytic murein transglycosylase B [Gammaproteobacteria bacterium]